MMMANKTKSLIELYATRVIYRVGYEDDEIDDEFDVIKLVDIDGKETWSVKAIDGDSILNSSKVGKKLINFIKNNGR